MGMFVLQILDCLRSWILILHSQRLSWELLLILVRSTLQIAPLNFLLSAPEIVAQKPHGKEVDWWSLGILLYELVVGVPPYVSENMHEVFDKIVQDPVEFPSNISLSKPLQDLILRLLNKDPEARLGHSQDELEEIMTHEWFNPIDWEK
jgi:serine/threonine protein kinase